MFNLPKDFLNYLNSIYHFDNIEIEDEESFESIFYTAKDFFIESGLTKGVFIHPDLDYVIKMPFPVDEDGNDLTDFCKKEHFIYRKACKANVWDFFMPIDYIGSIGKYHFYVQERVKSALDCGKSRTKGSPYERLPIEWCEDCKAYYGEDAFSKFIEFCKDNEIIDLHAGNVGYTYENQPVVFDYGGILDFF